MNTALTEQVFGALASFTGATRLLTLDVGDTSQDELLVEAFVAEDVLQDVGMRELIVLSTSAHLDIAALLGQPASLQLSLADGSRARFEGEICAAAVLGSDGGLARYRLSMASWTWRLAHARNSRVWQDKTIVEIVDAVFDAHRPAARWRWSEDVASFMDGVPARSYCCQYRESDLDFVRRLLDEEGLCWRFAQDEDGPVMVLFADSTRLEAVPDDPVSASEGAVRFHAASALERQDTVQALQADRQLQVSLATLLSADYKAARSIAASAPTCFAQSAALPLLEDYEVPGQYAFAGSGLARHHADLRMQAHEARVRQWQGRSTLRTLRAGTRLRVSGMPLRELGDPAAFTVVRVTSIGINNLPPPASQALAELFGPIPELLDEVARDRSLEELAPALAQARRSGYANRFEAVPAALPWRRPASTKPTALGAQSAIVIGRDGSDAVAGADELYCDRLGRVRIRFHWQDQRECSCWVRVAQRSAGSGMGSQFLPRIGQEVLVQFLENDIDRPVIVGALYNGRGEGGIVPTPGGQVAAAGDASCFASAHDHAPSGQGNLAGGNSPVWHGSAPDSAGHRNAAAQWGLRSKEFGGSGYNQLLFDDTDGQGRVQLRCTHAASELNMGHLVHGADNYRGSLRGVGVELRTDAYGAVRAGKGVLVTSHGITHRPDGRDPVGDNGPAPGQVQHASDLASTLHAAALAHRTVGLAAHAGAHSANASLLDDKGAPLQAMSKAMAGFVEVEGAGKLPYPAAPLLVVSAKDSFAATAGQSLQLSNGETVSLMSGQEMQFASGGRLRVHAGQAIGLLAGAIAPGEDSAGLQMIGAKDAIDIQAQMDVIKVQAKDELRLISAHAHAEWAAAKRISLSTAGGANITIDGGNILVQCPGKLTVNAGKKSFSGPVKSSYPLPAMPTSVCIECLMKARDAGAPFVVRKA